MKKTSTKTKAKVRMYRQGLGDCFLVTLPGVDGPYYVMIDCGVVLGTEKPQDKMRPVVENIIETTNGRVNVLVATHEHWDHLSGFLQAEDLFDNLAADQVWLGWTEDPNNKTAKRLQAERQERIDRVRNAVNGLRAASEGMGVDEAPLAGSLDELVGLFGAAGGNSTADALKLLRKRKPKYLKPSQPPIAFDGVEDFRVYVLGPPEDEAMLRKTDSTKEVYKDSAMALAAAEAFASNPSNAPFDASQCIPLDSVKTDTPSGPIQQFFDRYYFGKDTESVYSDQRWRRIDADQFGPAAEMALALDSCTNNTSLVLAIEHIPSGKVLLFAADAQVGNWLSWQDLKWKVDGDEVTGPDLLRRTVLYKVGHHGSHNATLREKGLELMDSPELIAMLPVNHEMAVKKNWGRMPLPALVKELKTRTQGRCIRIDEEFKSKDEAFAKRVESTPLYHEVTIEF